jgi:hypothetical protein
VEDVLPVPDAYVPVLKFTFGGISFDMLYASLAVDVIREDLDLKDNAVLRGCDERTARSLNGCRVTDTVLEVSGGKRKQLSFLHMALIFSATSVLFLSFWVLFLIMFCLLLFQYLFFVNSSWRTRPRFTWPSSS